MERNLPLVLRYQLHSCHDNDDDPPSVSMPARRQLGANVLLIPPGLSPNPLLSLVSSQFCTSRQRSIASTRAESFAYPLLLLDSSMTPSKASVFTPHTIIGHPHASSARTAGRCSPASVSLSADYGRAFGNQAVCTSPIASLTPLPLHLSPFAFLSSLFSPSPAAYIHTLPVLRTRAARAHRPLVAISASTARLQPRNPQDANAMSSLSLRVSAGPCSPLLVPRASPKFIVFPAQSSAPRRISSRSLCA